MLRYTRTLDLPHISSQQLAAWYERAGAFERLAPPWEKMTIVDRQGTIHDGDTLTFRIHKGPLSLIWEAHHEGYIAGRRFIDVQRRGPFARWVHVHSFETLGEHGTRHTDEVSYALPLLPAPLQRALRPLVEALLLAPMFTFRHERLMHDMTRHEKFSDKPRLRVAITGASGTVGRALQNFLTTGGHQVVVITRGSDEGKKDASAGRDTIHWDIEAGEIEQEKLEGLDAVVHLAGETINQRWSDDARRRILESRRKGTTLLTEALAKLEQKPKVLMSASAVGYYGSRGAEALTEESAPGDNFLATVCQAWEASTRAASEAGIRVVNGRFGVVLTPQGGALEQMLTPFKMGVGGKIGDGEQYMSWIAMDDLLGAIYEAIYNEQLEGPVNMTAPNPVTNAAFTDTLGKVLRRPTILPVPKLGLKVLLGEEAARELLLEGQRALPKRLEEVDFRFEYPELEGALRHLLGK